MKATRKTKPKPDAPSPDATTAEDTLELISVEQAAEVLGFTQNTIRRFITEGIIKPVRKGPVGLTRKIGYLMDLDQLLGDKKKGVFTRKRVARDRTEEKIALSLAQCMVYHKREVPIWSVWDQKDKDHHVLLGYVPGNLVETATINARRRYGIDGNLAVKSYTPEEQAEPDAPDLSELVQ